MGTTRRPNKNKAPTHESSIALLRTLGFINNILTFFLITLSIILSLVMGVLNAQTLLILSKDYFRDSSQLQLWKDVSSLNQCNSF